MKKLTLKKLNRMYKKLEKTKDPTIIYVDFDIYEKLYDIVYAPWYKKIYWQCCRPFWWIQEKIEELL